MLTATKVKLYPDQKQKVLLENHFGSCRFVYNHFLAEGDEYYLTYRYAEKSYLNYLDTQNMRIDLKEKCPWLYKIILNHCRCGSLRQEAPSVTAEQLISSRYTVWGSVSGWTMNKNSNASKPRP